jgi:hypothetical protein
VGSAVSTCDLAGRRTNAPNRWAGRADSNAPCGPAVWPLLVGVLMGRSLPRLPRTVPPGLHPGGSVASSATDEFHASTCPMCAATQASGAFGSLTPSPTHQSFLLSWMTRRAGSSPLRTVRCITAPRLSGNRPGAKGHATYRATPSLIESGEYLAHACHIAVRVPDFRTGLNPRPRRFTPSFLLNLISPVQQRAGIQIQAVPVGPLVNVRGSEADAVRIIGVLQKVIDLVGQNTASRLQRGFLNYRCPQIPRCQA